jgi:hypothetical protein
MSSATRDDFSHLANPGIAVQQLLKMKARGVITMQQFLELTAEAAGQHEERPITLEGTSAPAAAADAIPAARTERNAETPAAVTTVRDAGTTSQRPQTGKQLPSPAAECRGGIAACFSRAASSAASTPASAGARQAGARQAGARQAGAQQAGAQQAGAQQAGAQQADSSSAAAAANAVEVDNEEQTGSADDSEDDGEDDSEDDSEEEAEKAVQVTTAAAAAAGAEPATKRQRVDQAGSSHSTLTQQQQPFVDANLAPPAKIARERKPKAFKRNASGRGPSKKKNGGRKTDVSAQTLGKRVREWPGHQLKPVGGQLWCGLCKTNIGSGSQACATHCGGKKHTEKKDAADAGGVEKNTEQIQVSIHQFKGVLEAEGKTVAGLNTVDKETQVLRAETLEEIITAGIEVSKLSKLRSWIERRMGFSLADPHELMATYLTPLRMKEADTLRSEFAGDDLFVGQYHDGTTHNGEAFATVWRAVRPGFVFVNRCVRVSWFRGSLNNMGISASLLDTAGTHMRKPLTMVLANMHDCVSANLKSYNDMLSAAMMYSDDNGCLPHTGACLVGVWLGGGRNCLPHRCVLDRSWGGEETVRSAASLLHRRWARRRAPRDADARRVPKPLQRRRRYIELCQGATRPQCLVRAHSMPGRAHGNCRQYWRARMGRCR